MDGDRAQVLEYPFPDPPAPGQIVEVADRVFWLRLPLPLKLDHVNVYALDDGDGWTLIDTGFDTKSTRALWAELLTGPLARKPGRRPVKRVVITHHHPDHIGLAGWFQAEHRAELITTRTSWLMGRMLTLDEQEKIPAETVCYWRSAGMDPVILQKRLEERPFNFADVVAPLPLGYTRIRQGDQIELGGRLWDIHTGDGHAPEHATFWSHDGQVVLSGDQILPSISPNLGVHATEPMADPVGEWLASCERLATLTTPDQLILGGHKLPFRGGPVRMRQLIENHRGGLARLLQHLDTPKAASECFAPLFRRTIGESEYGLALIEAVAHVSHLFQTGQVTRERRDDGAWVYQTKAEARGRNG